jgi:histone deacetylase complex regulatory component SIN3
MRSCSRERKKRWRYIKDKSSFAKIIYQYVMFKNDKTISRSISM